jgi:hypothetical protein
VRDKNARVMAQRALNAASAQKRADAVQLPVYTLTELPPAAPSGRLIYVTDANGGPAPCCSDGTTWRRLHDNQTVS